MQTLAKSGTYEGLVDKTRFDQRGRAIVNVRWIVGGGGVIPMTTLHKIILLKRDAQDNNIVTHCNATKLWNSCSSTISATHIN